MQGFIFSEFQEYVQRTYGSETWDQITQKLNIQRKSYSLFGSYPTEELEKLVTELSLKVHKPYQNILEDYGLFLAPKLWRICKRMIPAKWSLLDLLENMMGFTNKLITHVISGSENPPTMRCVRTAPDEVTIHYISHRKMCAIGKGLVKGLGKQYDCDVSVREPYCLHRGDPECEMIFTVTKKLDHQ